MDEATLIDQLSTIFDMEERVLDDVMALDKRVATSLLASLRKVGGFIRRELSTVATGTDETGNKWMDMLGKPGQRKRQRARKEREINVGAKARSINGVIVSKTVWNRVQIILNEFDGQLITAETIAIHFDISVSLARNTLQSVKAIGAAKPSPDGTVGLWLIESKSKEDQK